MNIKDDSVYFVEETGVWWTKKAGMYYKENENKNFLDVIKPFLLGTKVAIQAGGHCGYMPSQFKTLFETVYTFEPQASSFLCVCLNNPEEKVIKMQACLGDQHGLFYIRQESPTESGASFVNDGRVHLFENGWGTPFKMMEIQDGRTPMIMIDDLNLKHCDFIQLDLEGYEYNAMIGGKNTINKFHPLLCLERVWSCRYGHDENITDKLLKDWGYVEVSGINTDHIYEFKG